jgi:hypothetical protein
MYYLKLEISSVSGTFGVFTPERPLVDERINVHESGERERYVVVIEGRSNAQSDRKQPK